MSSVYQINPYVLIDKEDQHKIVNTVTGEKLLVGDKIIEITEFLQHPKSMHELLQQFPDIAADLSGILDTLTHKKYLIKDNAFDIAITAIKPYTPHLFNLPYLSESKTAHYTSKPIGFIGVPLGVGNRSNHSSSEFPNSLRAFSNKYNINLGPEAVFETNALGEKERYSHLLELIKNKRLFDLGNVFFDSKESPNFMYEKTYQLSKKLFDQDKIIPFFIGGDHSMSAPVIKAAIEKYGNDLCVLHFDAHTDTYSSTYDKIKHPHEVHHHGNFMSKCFASGLKHAYQFGIRGLVNFSQKSNKNRSIYWAHKLVELIKNKHPFEELPKDKKYYITFDFDILDPVYFKGTTTPVINGLSVDQCKELLWTTLKNKAIIGVDIVELYTDTPEQEINKQIACEIIFELLNAIDK